jgi:intracellular septation protein
MQSPRAQTTEQSSEPQVDGAPTAEPAKLGKMLLEVGPLAVFFVANSYAQIFWATGAFMIATVIALVVSRALYGRIPIMPLVSGVLVMVFGGLTLWLHEEFFIKIKPTVVNLMFATALFGGLLAGHYLLRYVFGEVFRLTDRGWRLLTVRWASFFVFLAILNEIVWRSFSTEFWAAFKLFGIMPITMVFAISQIGLLKRYELPLANARPTQPADTKDHGAQPPSDR